jgi:hypothetical protein
MVRDPINQDGKTSEMSFVYEPTLWELIEKY